MKEVVDMENDNNIIGENIKKLRVKNRLTQESFAEKLDVCKQTVSKWEMGTTCPKRETVYRMAKLFDVPISDIEVGYISEEISSNIEMEKITDALNSINKRLSILLKDALGKNYNESVASKATKSFEEDILRIKQSADNSLEMYEESKYYTDMDKEYALSLVEGKEDLIGAVDICNAGISDGDAEYALTAIEAYDIWYKIKGNTMSEEEILKDLEEQKYYAQLYIQYLMNRFHLTREEQVDDVCI